MLFRFLGGIVSASACRRWFTIYTAEIAPARVRGRLRPGQFNIVFGILLAYALERVIHAKIVHERYCAALDA